MYSKETTDIFNDKLKLRKDIIRKKQFVENVCQVSRYTDGKEARTSQIL